ncbi:MAG: energy-coupling factor transporter transmembrane component T family protein [Promethearchaeota archaeon]
MWRNGSHKVKVNVISALSKTFFSYIPKNSVMLKFHPISKILISFILSVIAFIFTNVFDILILLILCIMLIILTKIPLFTKSFKKVIIGTLLLNLTIFIAWFFFSERPGKYVFFETNIIIIKDVWIWHILITEQTLFYAGRIVLRVIIMFFLMLFLFISISDRDLIYGLRSVKIPFAVCLMMSMTFRGIAMFQQEYSIIKEAMMTRGVEFEHTHILKKIKNFISIFVALIVLMFKKTEDMAASIEARGIPLRTKNRTNYQSYSFKKKDYIIIFGLLAFLGFSIYLRIINQSFTFLIIDLFL